MSKTLIPFGAVMASSIGMTVGGKKTSPENASDAGESAGQVAIDVAEAAGNAVGDAAKATGELPSPSKDTAVKTAQERLDVIEEKWQELHAKLQRAENQMAQALVDVKAKLVEAKDASDDTWQQNVKPALDAALQKAQGVYEDMAAWLDSK